MKPQLARGVVPSYPKIKDLKEEDMAKGNYASVGDGWIFCGKVSPVLPAGIYKAERHINEPILKPVTLNTDAPIAIPGSVAEKISKEVSHFWTLSTKYDEMGVLHKRGILMYGPPGSGKTSTAVTVARKVVEDDGVVFVLAGDDFHQLKQGILLLRKREERRPVLVLFEDLDNLVEDGYEEMFLSFLDGEDQVNHIAFLATTNSLEALGERIINRPCRFDVVLEVGMPTLTERIAYLTARLKDEQEAKKWAKETDGMSLAHLREMVVGVKCMGETHTDVLKRLRSMMDRKIEVKKN